eukprot:scpid8406/ scgid3585/ 
MQSLSELRILTTLGRVCRQFLGTSIRSRPVSYAHSQSFFIIHDRSFPSVPLRHTMLCVNTAVPSAGDSAALAAPAGGDGCCCGCFGWSCCYADAADAILAHGGCSCH